MSAILKYAQDLHVLECGVCGISHAIPGYLYRKASDDGKGWHCPNGHSLHFIETEKARLEKELAKEKQRREWAEGDRDRARQARDRQERRARAYKAVVTKTKKRVGNGVCPCCNRTFQNLLSHMKTKHPEYKDGGKHHGSHKDA